MLAYTYISYGKFELIDKPRTVPTHRGIGDRQKRRVRLTSFRHTLFVKVV